MDRPEPDRAQPVLPLHTRPVRYGEQSSSPLKSKRRNVARVYDCCPQPSATSTAISAVTPRCRVAGDGPATFRPDEERLQAVEDVLGGSPLPAAVQGWQLRDERPPAAQPVPQELQEGLQVGGRRHSQEAPRSTPVLPGFQGERLFLRACEVFVVMRQRMWRIVTCLHWFGPELLQYLAMRAL